MMILKKIIYYSIDEMCDENCDYNKVNIRLECAIKRLSPKTLSENKLDTCP